MPILCSGMIAASLAAPTGAQHCPPRALRGASGSSAPGNRLPQPTTQPVAKTYLPCIRPCIPPDNLPAAHTTVHAAVALPPRNYRKKLPPCATAGTPTPRTTYLPCMLPQPAAKTYLPLILPCIPPDNLPAAHTAVHTAVELPQKTTAVCYRRAYHQGILPCSGSRAQRAGDSDVGANDKGAGDDPGDGVDAH